MHAYFAILDLSLVVLYVICGIFASFSFAHPSFVIGFSLAYILACNINYHQIINLMKIDVSGYNSAIYRTLFLHVFSVSSFATVYYFNRDNLEGVGGWVDAIYFSAAMWTTLGFEKITPSGYFRLFSVFQAFSGLIHFAMFISMYWFYAQSAMEGASRRSATNTKPPIRLKQSRRFGFMELVDANNDPISMDARRYGCAPCRLCGSEDLRIREFYNWYHEFVHIPNFVVTCETCGGVGPRRHNAILAANLWNKKRPETRKPLRQTSPDGRFSIEGDLVVEEIRDGDSATSVSGTSGGWRFMEPLGFRYDPDGELPRNDAEKADRSKRGRRKGSGRN